MARILVVEDNVPLAEGIAYNLRHEGHEARIAEDGRAGLAAAQAWNPELIILDLTLPELDGYQVLQAVRRDGNQVPVIILTARGAPEERVRGLDLGADDYMIKPFDISEFEARVRMLLRRQAGLRSSAIAFGGIALDLNSRTFSAEGVPLDIPARELGLLEILFMRAGKVVAKEAIMQSLAALDDDLSANAIEQYVSRLRKRLAPHGLTVRTARGIGYYLDKATAA